MILFAKNKYTRWYYQIIDKARNRLNSDGYYEIHHIIPKGLGGSNLFYNLVKLTYREHYMVHWLLVKMTSGQARKKMLWALSRMIKVKGSKSKVKSSPSWLYSLARKALKEARTGYKTSEETKAKISKAKLGKPLSKSAIIKLTGRKHTNETRIKMSKSKLGIFGRKHSIETINKIRISRTGKNLGADNPRFGKTHSAETLDKMRKARLGKTHSEEVKLKISKANSGKNHPFFGRKHSLETIEKIRRAKINAI